MIGFPEVVYAVDGGQNGEALALADQRHARAGGGGRYRRHAGDDFDRRAVGLLVPHVLDEMRKFAVQHGVALGDEGHVPALTQPCANTLRCFVPGLVADRGIIGWNGHGQHFGICRHQPFHHAKRIAWSAVVQLGEADDPHFPKQPLGPYREELRVARANTDAIETSDLRHFSTYCTTTFTRRPGT